MATWGWQDHSAPHRLTHVKLLSFNTHMYKKLQYNFHFIASLWEGLFFLAHLFKLSQNFTKVCIIGGVATITITDRYVLTQV